MKNVRQLVRINDGFIKQLHCFGEAKCDPFAGFQLYLRKQISNYQAVFINFKATGRDLSQVIA